MTHDNQGKRWPPTAGVEADYITVEANGCGALAAERLRLHGIPHTTVFVGAAGRIARTPPVLEGWSFSVYSGAEEHASGWGSSSFADMAPALLAAVGMTDAATAHKRAQVAETRTIDLAGERDAAVEALDIANDMIGKLCTVMAGAGFDGDLLSAVGDLIESRNNAIKSRDSKQRELIEVRDALGPSRTADSVTVLAKRMRASLNRWEAVTRELAAGNPAPAIAVSVEDLADRHFDLRLALTNEVDRLKSVVSQAERMRAVLDRWQDLAVKHLPACPQVSFTRAVPDLGSRHFALRGYMEGEISALRDRLSLAAEREDLTIAALGHPCSTNGIPTEVEHLTSEVRRFRFAADSLAAETAAVRKALEVPEGASIVDHATNVLKESKRVAMERDEARKRTAEVLSELGETRALCHHYQQESKRAAVLSEEVTRLNATLENTGGYGAREAAKALRKENEALRNQVATLTAAVDGDLARSARVLAAVRTALETPEGAGLAEHAAKVLRRSMALDAWQSWGRNKIGVNATLSDENLRNAIDVYDSTVRKEATDWIEWCCRALGLSRMTEGWQLRAAIDSTVKTLTKDLADVQAAHTKTFAQLQEAYAAMNNGHEALTADAKEALDHLIAHPGRGLTAELACEGAKRLRRHIEHGLPATQPLRSLLDLALSSGVNAAHEMWDAEIQRTRGEVTALRKRLSQWVAWGCRAACLNAAPDEALRSEIDKALPMWRRGAPAV